MPGERASEDVRRGQILQASFEVAARDGVGGLTLRSVAAEAGLSHSLVVFYFQRKERLVLELLEWLLASAALRVPDEIAHIPGAVDRLHALLEHELARVASQPKHTRLFFEYWARGTQDRGVGERISAELERYRGEFRAIMEELLRADPAAFQGATADGMAAVAVSWLHGCAVQGMVAPGRFDVDDYLAAVRGFTGRLA